MADVERRPSVILVNEQWWREDTLPPFVGELIQHADDPPGRAVYEVVPAGEGDPTIEVPMEEGTEFLIMPADGFVKLEGGTLDMIIGGDDGWTFIHEEDGVRTERHEGHESGTGADMRAIFGDWAMDAAGMPPAPPDPDRDLAAELRDAREQHCVDSPEAHLAFQRRLAQVNAEDANEPEQWHWLSFASETDGRNLGASIVKARGIAGAAARAHELGINPGGEVKGWPLGDVRDAAWIETWTDRLISREDVLAGIPEPEAWG